MTFQEALISLSDRKVVARRAWNCFCHVQMGSDHTVKLVEPEVPWAPSQEDILADDWEEV